MAHSDMKAIIAVGAYRVANNSQPSRAWLSERMGWTKAETDQHLQRLRDLGYVDYNGPGRPRTTLIGVRAALDAWHASKLESAT